MIPFPCGDATSPRFRKLGCANGSCGFDNGVSTSPYMSITPQFGALQSLPSADRQLSPTDATEIPAGFKAMPSRPNMTQPSTLRRRVILINRAGCFRVRQVSYPSAPQPFPPPASGDADRNVGPTFGMPRDITTTTPSNPR